jgi:hypothetical protein
LLASIPDDPLTVLDQGARKHVLLSSLFDGKRYKAADLVACLARRWQIEIAYRESSKPCSAWR